MAYNNANLQLLVAAIAGSPAPNLWSYSSADVAASVDNAGYISDGGARGMKVNDLVLVSDTTTPLITTHLVLSVNATTGAVDLGNGTTVGLNTNSD